MSPSRRGAGVAPPSGERFMLRALQTSMFPGVHGPTKGQPSCTISEDCFQRADVRVQVEELARA